LAEKVRKTLEEREVCRTLGEKVRETLEVKEVCETRACEEVRDEEAREIVVHDKECEDM
jgi:hypothetical protein